MSGVRRLVVGCFAIVATLILGIIIDTVGAELMELAESHGVDEGPFEPVLTMMDGIIWLIVPFLLLGIMLWLIWGSVQEERREEQIRRVP